MAPSKAVIKAYEAAKKARESAYAPYSKFRVGAAFVGPSGAVDWGCNVENASYGATVCAERVALLKAVSEGRTEFEDLVVVIDAREPVPPCALCLQLMAEFLGPEARIWLANLSEIKSSRRFSELLPSPFGPRVFASAQSSGEA